MDDTRPGNPAVVPKPRTTIHVVDMVWAGSIITFHKLFVSAFLRQGCRVISVSPAPDEVADDIRNRHPELLEHFRSFPISSRIDAIPRKKLFSVRLSNLRRKLTSLLMVNSLTGLYSAYVVQQSWKVLAERLNAIKAEHGEKPDHVFFAYLDPFLNDYLTASVIDRVFPFSWSGLYLHPIEFRLKRTWQTALKLLHRSPSPLKSVHCRAVFINDEGISDSVGKWSGGKPVITLPDFTDETLGEAPGELELEIRKWAGTRKVIGLFGEISLRKGILAFLEAARRVSKSEPDWAFVVAGPLGPGSCSRRDERIIRKAMNASAANCAFHLRRIADGHEFNSAVRACDIVFAAYENICHGSSALLKAALCKRLVIGSEGYLIEERIKRFRLGLCIPQGDVTGMIEAIRRLLQGQDFHGVPLSPNFSDYCREHSIARSDDCIRQLLALLRGADPLAVATR